jgi:hypothetical protein
MHDSSNDSKHAISGIEADSRLNGHKSLFKSSVFRRECWVPCEHAVIAHSTGITLGRRGKAPSSAAAALRPAPRPTRHASPAAAAATGLVRNLTPTRWRSPARPFHALAQMQMCALGCGDICAVAPGDKNATGFFSAPTLTIHEHESPHVAS